MKAGPEVINMAEEPQDAMMGIPIAGLPKASFESSAILDELEEGDEYKTQPNSTQTAMTKTGLRAKQE